MQPHYWELESKIKARACNIAAYRELTGNQALPQNKGYWTLCNEQPPDSEGTEIIQLVSSGLIATNQFFGVDNDKSIISKNEVWHPEAKWFFGDWLEVIKKNISLFDPGLIYLDATNMLGKGRTAHKLVKETMYLCPFDTVLAVNFMLNDPRSSIKFNEDILLKEIVQNVGPIELAKWSKKVINYSYNATGKTEMMTYILYKTNKSNETI